MRFTSILVFAACLLSSAQAEDSPVANTWLDTFIRTHFAAPEPWGTVLQVHGVSIGGHAFVLEATPLADLAGILKTEAHYWEAEAGGAIEWACLSRGAETLWIYADTAMGAGTVSGIGIDMRDAAPASAGCGVWPADLAVDLGLMGIGMPADVIAASYLTGQPDEHGVFGKVNQIETPGDPAFTTMEELTFRANNEGFIDAVAVLQMSD